MGEAERRQSGSRVDLIAAPISRLLRRRAVVSQSIGLDDQTQLGPEEIHAKAVDMSAGLRRWQASSLDQSEKSPLELGVGQPENAAIKDADERTDTTFAAHLTERQTQSLRIDEIESIGLIDGCFQLCLGYAPAEVGQRARRACDRNSRSSSAIEIG
jgi:hypothetical protein